MTTKKDIRVVQNVIKKTKSICRLCGRKDLNLINVNSKRGLKNDLLKKIEMYIPIKLMEHENSPPKCCLECVETILSWHDYILKVIETNKKISNTRNLNPNSTANQLDKHFVEGDAIQSTNPSQQAFHQVSDNNMSEHTSVEPQLVFEENEIKRRDIEHPFNLYLYSEEESEYKQCLEDITSTSHSSDARLTSDCDDDGKKISNRTKRIHKKIDPKIIEEAKVITGDKTYYNCKDCGKSLLSPYTYVWHMRIHTGERPFMCDLCGKLFRISQGLVRHLKETHKRIKNFPCDLCGRMFATKRNVEEHRRIHTNERPYICALCEKSFKQKASLFVHNRTHSNYFPFKCEYCSKRFRTKPPLLIHTTKHTGQKPHSCETCGRSFRIKYELKLHKLVHSEEKPFVCSSCGLRFKQKRYLRNHFKTNHTDILDLKSSLNKMDQTKVLLP